MSQQQLQHPAATRDGAVADQRLSSYRFVIGGLTMLVNLSLGLSFFAVAPVTPLIMEDYGINRSTASLLIGLVILVQSGFAIPAGMLVGRVGLKKLIGIAWLLSAAPTLSFLATSFPLLLAVRVAYGLSFAIMIPALGPILMQWFRPRELPLINAMNVAIGGLGITLSTFIVAPLAALVGWKGALSLLGATSLLGVACWAGLGRVEEPAQRTESRHLFSEIKAVLRSRTTLLLALADAGPFTQYVVLTAWLPTFFYEVHGMSLSKAGAVVGVLPLTGVFTVLIVGFLTLRIRRRRPFLIVPGLLVGAAGFGSFLLGDSLALYPALVLLGIASWSYLPVLFTIPMELPNASPERVALVWAAIITVGGVMSFLGPLTVGALTDTLGTYIPGFALFAVLASSLAVGGFLLPETGAREPGKADSEDVSSPLSP